MYAAQVIQQIDTEIAQKGRFQMETKCCHKSNDMITNMKTSKKHYQILALCCFVLGSGCVFQAALPERPDKSSC